MFFFPVFISGTLLYVSLWTLVNGKYYFKGRKVERFGGNARKDTSMICVFLCLRIVHRVGERKTRAVAPSLDSAGQAVRSIPGTHVFGLGMDEDLK